MALRISAGRARKEVEDIVESVDRFGSWVVVVSGGCTGSRGWEGVSLLCWWAAMRMTPGSTTWVLG